MYIASSAVALAGNELARTGGLSGPRQALLEEAIDSCDRYRLEPLATVAAQVRAVDRPPEPQQ